MHFHMEVVMPPLAAGTDIDVVLDELLEPFSENNPDGHNQFWDWWVIGGRWAGQKEACTYDSEKLSAFYKEMEEKKVTVSSIVAGKEEISPASQIPMVDEMWHKYFPTEDGEIVACPLFRHSNNQYDGNDLLSCDISRVDELPKELTCARVVIAGPGYEDGTLAVENMYVSEVWNGATHQKTTWNGKVKTAINNHNKRIRCYRKEYREKYRVKSDWLCVTVDYHS